MKLLTLGLGLMVTAALLFGQTNAITPDRLIQNAVNGAVRATLDPTVPKLTFRIPRPPEAVNANVSACAVPLTEMKIPADVDFTMRKAPAGSTDPMPAGHALPACPQKH